MYLNKVNRSAVYEDIQSFFEAICDCLVDLEQVRVECSTSGDILLSGTVVYSNNEGYVTASTLIDMLQVWLLTSTNPVITLQNQSFNLITQCPVRLTSATVNACRDLKPVAASVDRRTASCSVSAAVSGSFIGGVLTGILACLATVCIGLW